MPDCDPAAEAERGACSEWCQTFEDGARAWTSSRERCSRSALVGAVSSRRARPGDHRDASALLENGQKRTRDTQAPPRRRCYRVGIKKSRRSSLKQNQKRPARRISFIPIAGGEICRGLGCMIEISRTPLDKSTRARDFHGPGGDVEQPEFWARTCASAESDRGSIDEVGHGVMTISKAHVNAGCDFLTISITHLGPRSETYASWGDKYCAARIRGLSPHNTDNTQRLTRASFSALVPAGLFGMVLADHAKIVTRNAGIYACGVQAHPVDNGNTSQAAPSARVLEVIVNLARVGAQTCVKLGPRKQLPRPCSTAQRRGLQYLPSVTRHHGAEAATACVGSSYNARYSERPWQYWRIWQTQR